jgi:hypothetical protein
MSLLKVTGILLAVGSIVFLTAAFHPVSRIFAESNSTKQSEIIMNERAGWNFSQVLFAMGSLIVAIAIGVSFYHFRDLPWSLSGLIGFILVMIGSLLWSYHCYLRYIDPTSFTDGSMPNWHFIVYSFLTMGGMILFGFLLLKSEIRNWVSLAMIIANGLFLVLFLVFKDMPPFVYYVITLIAGIVMVI